MRKDSRKGWGAGLAVLLAACGGDGGAGARIVVVGLNADVDAFNPLVTTSYYAQEIDNQALFTPLIQYDERLEPIPWLAESWEELGDSAVVFNLRSDVRWHDGTPLTADDVLFTFERAKEPTSASLLGSVFLKDVASAEVEGPHRIRFDYVRPHAQALEDFWWAPVPRHLLENVPSAELARAPFNRAPVGSGPFRLEEWRASERIVLVRNPDFPAGLGGPAASEKIVMRIVPEATTLLTELITGGVHVDIAVLPEQARTIEENAATRLFAFPGRSVFYLGWNNQRPPFDDPALRRALASALDVQSIIAGLLDGRARAANGTIPPGHPLYPTDVPPLAHDPEDSRRRLERAGWVDVDGDGVREKNGVPLRFELLTAPDAVRQNVAQAVQSQLREVGAQAELRVLEFQTMLQLHRDRDFDAIVTSWTLDNFQMAGAPYALLHSSQADVPRSANRSGVRDPALDSLIERGAAPLSTEELLDVWRGATRRLQETQPVTFLFWLDELAGARRELEGVEMDARGELRTIARWRLGGS
jgi:peptide/nickel transport system substrate-binding protein